LTYGDTIEFRCLAASRVITHDSFTNFSSVNPVSGGNIRNSNCLFTLEDDPRDSSIGAKEKVMLDIHDAVDVCFTKSFRTTTF
jgi:hypothetical protein